MFDWFFRFLRWLGILGDKKAKIVIIGLDNAGKTTLLHSMKTHHFEKFEQTQSFCKETIKFGNVLMTCLDLGGHQSVRQAWKDYLLDANAVVFVIDGADRDRMDEAKTEFNNIMEMEQVKKVPVLVLGNKQDVVGCLSRSEIQEFLGIKEVTPLDAKSVPSGKQAIRVQMISAKQDFGYEVAFTWLAHLL